MVTWSHPETSCFHLRTQYAEAAFGLEEAQDSGQTEPQAQQSPTGVPARGLRTSLPQAQKALVYDDLHDTEKQGWLI